MLSVVVVTDERSDYEALYLEGRLHFADAKISAADIDSVVKDGEAIQFKHRVVDMRGEQVWPLDLSTLESQFNFVL